MYVYSRTHTHIYTCTHDSGANIGGVVLKKLPEGSGFASFEVNVRTREEMDTVMSQLKVCVCVGVCVRVMLGTCRYIGYVCVDAYVYLCATPYIC